jgi:hypothetical protein
MRYYRSTHRYQDIAAALMFNQLFSNRTLQKILKAISGHGLFPILVATGVTITGHSSMTIRSIALLICATWLTADAAVWLSEKCWKLYTKAAVFSVVFTLSFCCAMLIMRWFLSSALEDQQEETFNRLSLTFNVPPSGLRQTIFTITNSGEYEIVSSLVSCSAITAVFTNETRFGQVRLWAGIPKVLLDSGGDGESFECFDAPAIRFNNGSQVRCADIVIALSYVLDNQPTEPRSKYWRYLGDENRGTWYPIPLHQMTPDCKDF